MQRVIRQSIVITLEIAPSGVSKSLAERAADTIAGEWLRWIGEQIELAPSLPTYQITLRHLPFSQGTQIQILLCWIVLQAQRQEINDFDRT